MNLLLSLAFLIYFTTHFYAHCITNTIKVHTQITLVVPGLYVDGFIGRAFILDTSQPVPNFRAGLTVESIQGKYVCSFDVFLGDFKVWSSGHFSQFYTFEKCVLVLTRDGDLLLTGHKDEIGWRTATYGRGIKRLQLSNTGNLVLVDEFDMIKWQSFHFPTNVILWGQTIDVGTRLTTLPTNSTSNSFYSFEIHREKIALYLNSDKFKYTYWEFNPSKPRKIAFIRLALDGLQIFNDETHKIAQIPSKRLQLLRFLSIENNTGNLGLYYYSTLTQSFESSFQAIRRKCDQPMFCQSNDICMFSNECSCLEIDGFSPIFCGKSGVDMVEIRGATSILRDENKKIVGTTKETCAGSCIKECTCVAALFTSGINECFLYGELRGVKQVGVGEGVSFMVKVFKGGKEGKRRKGLKKWALVLIVVGDGLILFACLSGIAFYIVWKRRRKEANNN